MHKSLDVFRYVLDRNLGHERGYAPYFRHQHSVGHDSTYKLEKTRLKMVGSPQNRVKPDPLGKDSNWSFSMAIQYGPSNLKIGVIYHV